MKRHFASDNNAGVHPEVLRALASVNDDHEPAYGADSITKQLDEVFTRTFGEGARGFVVFGGTAANILPLRHLTREHEAIVCAHTAHIHVDECGAVEATAGRKLLVVQSTNGKLTPDVVRQVLVDRGDVHRVQPRVLSISQATEYGTVYTLDETRALCDFARAEGMLVHMDGARIANAAAALGVSLRAATRDAGIDVLSFGGTKNGLLGADSVVFFDAKLAEGFEFTRKQMLQLGSKMRFLAAQFLALLENDLWRRNAEHANAMGALLAKHVRDVAGVTITQSAETNAVFATLSRETIARLRERWRFGTWNEAASEVRWMAAWDTTEDDVLEFARDVAAAAKG